MNLPGATGLFSKAARVAATSIAAPGPLEDGCFIEQEVHTARMRMPTHACRIVFSNPDFIFLSPGAQIHQQISSPAFAQSASALSTHELPRKGPSQRQKNITFARTIKSSSEL